MRKEIWLVDIRRFAALLSDLEPTAWNTKLPFVIRMHQDEQRRFLQLQDRTSQLQRWLSHCLRTRAVLQRLGTRHAQRMQWTRHDEGRPCLLVESDSPRVEDVPWLNISHDGDWIVCALNEGPQRLGVDLMTLQWPRGVYDIQTLQQQMGPAFTSQEWQFIREASSSCCCCCCLHDWTDLERFYLVWCAKESYVKMLGRGLAYCDPIRLEVRPCKLNGWREEGPEVCPRMRDRMMKSRSFM